MSGRCLEDEGDDGILGSCAVLGDDMGLEPDSLD
jgi:hypothetical protein